MNELGSEHWQLLVPTFCPTILQCDVLAFNIALVLQSLQKCGDKSSFRYGSSAAEKADHRHRPLLRPRRQRPSRRAAQQRDELAPVRHSITSSVRAARI